MIFAKWAFAALLGPACFLVLQRNHLSNSFSRLNRKASNHNRAINSVAKQPFTICWSNFRSLRSMIEWRQRLQCLRHNVRKEQVLINRDSMGLHVEYDRRSAEVCFWSGSNVLERERSGHSEKNVITIKGRIDPTEKGESLASDESFLDRPRIQTILSKMSC